MGMGTAPCSAYILPATKENFEKLNMDLGRYKKEYEEFKKNHPDDLEVFFEELIIEHGNNEVVLEATPDEPLGAVISVELYRYNSEEGDRYDELEDGVYFIFYEEELYTRELTLVGEAMQRNDVFPELKYWTTYG